MRRRAVTAVVAGVLVLAGCGSVRSGTTDPAGDSAVAGSQGQPVVTQGPAVSATLVHCPRQPTELPGDKRVPAGFVPAEVMACDTATRAVTGAGTWMFRRELRVTAGTEALLAALRRPDEKAPAGQVCTLEMRVFPELHLVDSTGAATHADVPRDGCGQPHPEVMRAYAAVRLQTVAEVRLHQLESESVRTTGCPGSAKDMIALGLPRPPAGTDRSVFPERPAGVTVCLYRSAAANGVPGGTFVTGRRVSGAGLDRLLTSLAAAGPAGPCRSGHTRFAVISAPTRVVQVELDGCRRIATDAGRLLAGDAELVALVERLARTG
jgi:hypothetical protein